MKTRLEQLNYLYDKYNTITDGTFHNTLWQLMINQRFTNSKAFVHIIGTGKDGCNVGIAVANEPGYSSAQFSIKGTKGMIEAMIDELNMDVFGVMPEQASNIVVSSMRAQNLLEIQ